MSNLQGRDLLPVGNSGVHLCPAARCPRTVPADHLMCRPHWFMVPKALRNQVWAAYQDGEGIGTDELVDAQLAAISAVNTKLNPGNAR